MRSKAPRVAAGVGIIPNMFAFFGPRAPVGTYTVKLIKDKDTYTGQVTIAPDPRSEHTAADRAAQQEILKEHKGFISLDGRGLRGGCP